MSKHISLASYELETAARAEGYAHVCGADEAGAGPLMGPVYAAAVILPREAEIPGLNDSKKVSPKKRDILFEAIKEQAVAWAVGAGLLSSSDADLMLLSPDESATRAQVAVMLQNFAEKYL